MSELLNIKLSPSEILKKRTLVYQEFILKSSNIKSGRISSISALDLKLLYELYDEIFFNDFLCKTANINISFSLSKRMTSAAGKTIYPISIDKMNLKDVNFEIRMAVSFFFNYYKTEDLKLVNGITTTDSLHAFQLVFEHELCHVLELVFFKTSSCRKENFKLLASNLFGHKDVYHALPTSRSIAKEQYGFEIGHKVSFSFENKTITGFISNIAKACYSYGSIT